MQEFDFSPYRKILIVTAHPDDLECHLGGFCALAAGQKVEVHSLVFSTGDNGLWYKTLFSNASKHALAKEREQESHYAAKILDLCSVKSLGYKDRHVRVDQRSIKQVIDYVSELKPDLVLSFEPSRIRNFNPHRDHLAVGRIVQSAYSKSGGYDYFVFAKLNYNYYVDITSMRRRKMAAVAAHESQSLLLKYLYPFIEVPILLWGRLRGVPKSVKWYEILATPN